MSEEKDLVLRREATSLAIPSSAIPDNMRFDRLTAIVHSTDIPFREKRNLIKIETQAICESRKKLINSTLRIEDLRLAANEEVARVAITAYKEHLIFGIRDEFTKTMRNDGLRVNEEQFNFLADYAELLTRYQEDLSGKKLSQRQKEALMNMADKAFDAAVAQFAKLAGDIFASSAGKDIGS